MTKAIEILMQEHRLIERVLGSLETYVGGLERGRPAERPTLADYAGFFRGFADACHHGKEEDLLFRRMLERGFPRERGPLAVMLHEHTLGRQRVRALADVAAGSGALSPVETQLVIESASGFVELLRAHILKEDQILYPMAERLLSGPELDALETEFERYDRTQRASGALERFHAIAAELAERFKPAAQGTVVQLAGCHAAVADTVGVRS